METEKKIFNHSLYDSESIKKAVTEYEKAFGKEVVFKVKKIGKYSEVFFIFKKSKPEGFLDEFSNFLLSLNID